jgi:hypothetical protein
MDALKAGIVLFVAAIVQLSVLTEYRPFRTASIVLVALLSIALLRGSVFGAVAGFMTGLLLDTATLGTLGITSLLLTVEPAPAGLVAHGIPGALLLNLILTLPVYALARRMFPSFELGDRVREVRLLG